MVAAEWKMLEHETAKPVRLGYYRSNYTTRALFFFKNDSVMSHPIFFTNKLTLETMS